MNFSNMLPAFLKSKEVPKGKHLDRVHLIVHPGDGTDSRDAATDAMLLGAMSERAMALETRSELAVLLLQMNGEKLQEVRGPSYEGRERVLADEIGRMEAVLPQNLIIVPGVVSVFDATFDDVCKALRIRVQELGFSIDEETDVLAYGEMITRCVPVAASRFTQYFGMRKRPTVDANCTDALISEPAMWKPGGMRLSFSEAWSEGRIRFLALGQTEQPPSSHTLHGADDVEVRH